MEITGEKTDAFYTYTVKTTKGSMPMVRFLSEPGVCKYKDQVSYMRMHPFFSLTPSNALYHYVEACNDQYVCENIGYSSVNVHSLPTSRQSDG